MGGRLNPKSAAGIERNMQTQSSSKLKKSRASLKCPSSKSLVIFRKICFGTRSTDGSYSHSVLPGLLQTAKRQGKHPLDFFQTLFTSDTATAQNALYKNSS
jgi:hypothetical protein